jgi:hypothetical protein
MNLGHDKGIKISDESYLSSDINVSADLKILLVEVELVGNHGVVRRASPPL